MNPDKCDHILITSGDILKILITVIHQQVNLLPSVRIIGFQPQQAENHDGIVGWTCRLYIIDVKPRTNDYLIEIQMTR